VETFATSYPSPARKGGSSRSLEHPHSTQSILDRLNHIYGLTGNRKLLKIIRAKHTRELPVDEINNCLMAIFRDHALVEAYSMLYELNYKRFMLVIFNKIKYYCHLLDPKDILQDVFLSIYRYPARFKDEKKYAFRNWTYSIIRNTIFKHLKTQDPHEYASDVLKDILEDRKTGSPLNNLVTSEGLKGFKKLYILYLILYLNIVNNYLSSRERLALQLVEVEDKRYREAAEILGIKLENFKMVVCRARKKILKHMNRLLGEDES
jgi:RNA polymerase sigma factor (sigma-70 family)